MPKRSLYREAFIFFGFKLRREPLYDEIRTRYEELARKYRSDPEEMARINEAYQRLLRGPRVYFSIW